MKNLQKEKKTEELLEESLVGVKKYLSNWSIAPQNFTTEQELKTIVTKVQEMKDSIHNNRNVPILGLWRILETWPYKNDLRKKIIEAEYKYERMNKIKESHKIEFKN